MRVRLHDTLCVSPLRADELVFIPLRQRQKNGASEKSEVTEVQWGEGCGPICPSPRVCASPWAPAWPSLLGRVPMAT